MSESLNRRLFLQGSAAAGLGYFFTAPAFSAMRAADSPGSKLRFAGIGVGGKGDSDISQAGKLGEVVAICDIDENTLDKKAKQFPQAKRFFDYRKMLEEMEKEIDAVTVSTPDHSHALPSVMAMRMKKHVYCQKPLTHSVFEARILRETAKKYGVCTQMGNQGTAADGLRRGVEFLQEGGLGKVKEVHVWTNRPIWPQAPTITKRPEKEFEIPKHIHWNEFIGPAPMRPYAPGYHPFAWRGWIDFGTGALGDMGCHTANLAFMGLKLGSPTTVTAEAGDVNPETYPAWAHVTLQFPARGDLSPVTFNWYEGKKDGKLVHPPQELQDKVIPISKRKALVASGSIIVGEKGILYSPDDYGSEWYVWSEKEIEKLNRTKPEKLKSNNQGDQGQKNEWVEAIKAGKPELAFSNFDYGSMLTEAILLGNVAILSGEKLTYDGKTGTCPNNPKAAKFIKTEYRKGWDLVTEV